MFIQNINPDILNIGPFAIRFYGIVYALGFLWVTHVLSKKAERGKIKNLTSEKAVDLVTIGMIAGLIGARLIHVISEFSLYQNNLLDVFAVWKGGLGFHGGLIGGIGAMYLYCRKHKINLLDILDTISVPLALVTAFGRVANFINSEHLGFPSSQPWCVVFQRIDDVCRHPVQIYESITQVAIFGILLFAGTRKHKRGMITGLYLVSYAIFRIITDFFRETHAVYMFSLSGSQILCILMIIIGGAIIYSSKK
jgi:phosphatidylglycerol:prolipoprotein diacylglycerol transferase